MRQPRACPTCRTLTRREEAFLLSEKPIAKGEFNGTFAFSVRHYFIGLTLGFLHASLIPLSATGSDFRGGAASQPRSSKASDHELLPPPSEPGRHQCLGGGVGPRFALGLSLYASAVFGTPPPLSQAMFHKNLVSVESYCTAVTKYLFFLSVG